jgi:predicted metal-dependent HD superfamily phosphohydrolase
VLRGVHDHVTQLLLPLKQQGYAYHNLEHTLHVVESAILLKEKEKVHDEQAELIIIAAYFHDTGIAVDYKNHEDVSKKLASNYLHSIAYPLNKIEEVQSLIQITKPDSISVSLSEQILRDADLSNLGSERYFKVLKKLKQEWKNHRPDLLKNNNEVYYNYALEFLDKHNYLTRSAREIWNHQKLANRANLLNLIKKSRKKNVAMKEEKIKKTKASSLLADSKVGQMIFKTSLRNHIDLSSLADSKASTMLSVNTLIITIALPIMIPRIQEFPLLGIPASILLITCVSSIFYATLVTRPIKMNGLTSIETLQNGNGDLFFFGNFFKMPFDQYKKGIEYTLENANYLDESIIRDLYFSGIALGKKYGQLRICYTIFISGVLLAAVGFFIIMLLKLPVQ